MVSEKWYPNFVNRYFYNPGSKCILLKRFRGKERVYLRWICFDSPKEALEHFTTNCGA